MKLNNRVYDRRRLLQMITLASLAVPAAALGACAGGATHPPRFRQGGGNRGGEKSGGRGGPGGAGSR
jgi:hypothetical protein